MENEPLKVETRPCKDCIHFKKDTRYNKLGICMPKLMTVTEDMKVAFKKETCFTVNSKK